MEEKKINGQKLENEELKNVSGGKLDENKKKGLKSFIKLFRSLDREKPLEEFMQFHGLAYSPEEQEYVRSIWDNPWAE
jgi:hypothetical protein